MTLSPESGIAAVVVIMIAMTGGIKLLERIFHPHPEIPRKLMHIGMGLVVLTFPWVFVTAWPVVVLASASTAMLLAVKFLPRLRGIGSILSSVKRPSLGEVYFPVSVGALFLFSGGNKILYTLPLLILTIGDTMAALIGLRYGRIRYQTSDGSMKSAEGSIAFFTAAFFSVHVPLLLFTSVGRTETLLISLILGLLVMLLEAVAWRGLDNLFIPLGGYAFLKLYLTLTAHALALRLIATVLLVSFTLAWRRRTTLDDSALIACGLFGYAAMMIGGPQWLLAPLLFFLGYCMIWPRGERERFSTVYAVVAVISTPLLCLLAYARWGWPQLLFPYTLAFTAHFAFVQISTIPFFHSRLKPMTRAASGVLGAWILVLVPVLAIYLFTHEKTDPPIHLYHGVVIALGTLALVGFGAACFYRILIRIKNHLNRLPLAHITGASIAFALAATSILLWSAALP
jgi:phytol kinase